MLLPQKQVKMRYFMFLCATMCKQKKGKIEGDFS